MFLSDHLQHVKGFTINFIDECYLLRFYPGSGFLQSERKSTMKLLIVPYQNAWDARGVSLSRLSRYGRLMAVHRPGVP